jgi:hypothetical protein
VRDFLDAILAFIVAESLTDDEFDSVVATMPIYDQTSYDDLARILEARESVSVMQDRLLAYYEAKGVDINPADTGKSDIFMGAVLE